MQLLKVSALNGAAVAVRMLTGLVTNKLLALFVGPSGYAVIGQFQNVVTMAATLAGTVTAQGVTRYTAEYHGDEARQARVWRTAGTVLLLGAVPGAVGLALASRHLAEWLLLDATRAPVFWALAACLIPIGINAQLLAILAGRKDTRRYVIANVAGSLAGLILTGVLAWHFGLTGALFAVAMQQAVALLLTAAAVRHQRWFTPRSLFGEVDRKALAGLARYAAMAMTAAVASPLAQTLVRQTLVDEVGIRAAGVWDGTVRLSGMVMLFFTSTLSIYLLPRIAEIVSASELRREVRRVSLLAICAVSITLLLIFQLRQPLVHLLFSAEFLEITELLRWQFIGDLFKIVAWVFAFTMIGRGQTIPYIVCEVASSATYVIMNHLAILREGLAGTPKAYALTYALYLSLTAAFFVFTSGPRQVVTNVDAGS